jgi:hypothetical protein
MDRQSFDQQLFSSRSGTAAGGGMEFYDIVLKVQVGQFPVGTRFPLAFISGFQSMIVLVDEQDQEYAFDLKLSVGEALDFSAEEECDDDCICDDQPLN